MSFDPNQFDLSRPEHAGEIFFRLSLNEIAEAWCAYQETNDEPYWWAVDLMWSDPYLADRPRREKFLEILIDTAPNDDVLAVAAAGPLEDAIYDSDECVSWLEARAVVSLRFRQALGEVWIWNVVSPERFARIERAAGASVTETPLRVLRRLPHLGGYGTESHGHLLGHVRRHPALEADAA